MILEFENRSLRMQAQFDAYYSRRMATSMSEELYNHGTNAIGGGHRDVHLQTNGEDQETAVPYPSNLYFRFFKDLALTGNGGNTYRSLKQLQSRFSAIAQLELGDLFYRAAMFTPTVNHSIRVHFNWRYLYTNRRQLEENWRNGHYTKR